MPQELAQEPKTKKLKRRIRILRVVFTASLRLSWLIFLIKARTTTLFPRGLSATTSFYFSGAKTESRKDYNPIFRLQLQYGHVTSLGAWPAGLLG